MNGGNSRIIALHGGGGLGQNFSHLTAEAAGDLSPKSSAIYALGHTLRIFKSDKVNDMPPEERFHHHLREAAEAMTRDEFKVMYVDQLTYVLENDRTNDYSATQIQEHLVKALGELNRKSPEEIQKLKELTLTLAADRRTNTTEQKTLAQQFCASVVALASYTCCCNKKKQPVAITHPLRNKRIEQFFRKVRLNVADRKKAIPRTFSLTPAGL